MVGHRTLNGRDTILLRIKTAPKKAGDTKVAASSDFIWLDSSTTWWFRPSISCRGHCLARIAAAATWQSLAAGSTNVSVVGGRVTWSPVLQNVTWLSPTPGNWPCSR